MGKRSNFERNPRDFYPTPPEAVAALLPHLIEALFVEPCAGDGALSNWLLAAGMVCVDRYDIEPRLPGIRAADALTERPKEPFDFFITNPPWRRAVP